MAPLLRSTRHRRRCRCRGRRPWSDLPYGSGSRPWSDLPYDLLDLILQRLSLLDYFTFAKVCISWRSFFFTRYQTDRPPCMMLIGNGKKIRSGTLTYVDGLKTSEFRSPRLKLHHSEQIVGSSMGWLVIGSDDVSHLYLLNPTTKEKIRLPSKITGRIPIKCSFTFSYGLTCFSVHHVDLSSAPNSGHDCVLVAQGYIDFTELVFAYCRPGDRSWTKFRQSWMSDVGQTVFYKGDMYALSFDRKTIDVCSFDPQPKTTCSLACNINGSSHQFVVADGELLMVVWQLIGSTVPLQVFKHEPPDRWVAVESLGDRMLLIGCHGAESCSAQDLIVGSGFEANCIYYDRSGHLLVKFSMMDGSSEVIPLRRLRLRHCESHNVEWIVPQAW